MKFIFIFLCLLAISTVIPMEKKERKTLPNFKLAPATAINKKYLKQSITKPGRLAELVDPRVADIGLDQPATVGLEKPSSVNWKALAKRVSRPGRLASCVDSQTAHVGTDQSQDPKS